MKQLVGRSWPRFARSSHIWQVGRPVRPVRANIDFMFGFLDRDRSKPLGDFSALNDFNRLMRA